MVGEVRLIDADALKEYVREQTNLPLPKDRLYMVVPIEGFITTLIDNAPTIEAEPTKHGRWLIGVGENGEPIGTYCSECGWSWERNIAAIQLNKVLSRIETPRCPNCGAKMDEAEK